MALPAPYTVELPRRGLLMLHRSSDGQWAVDGAVKRLWLRAMPRPYLGFSAIVGPWSVNLGWERR